MAIEEIFKGVLLNIKLNKFKVFLTSLGIIVGSLTIIFVIGIGKGSQAEVEEQFKSLSVGTIHVMTNFRASPNVKPLDKEDLERIKEQTQNIDKAVISVTTSTSVLGNGESMSASTLGSTQDIKDTNNLNIKYGRFISDEDIKRAKIAVLGYDVAEGLFEEVTESILGEYVTIKGKRYEVVGILEQIGDTGMRGFNPDEGVIVPYETATSYLIGKKSKPNITVLAKGIDYVDPAIEDIKEILSKEYKEDDLMIRDAGSKLVTARESAKSMSILLMAIGTIVLIVGGIGIMNVMFVSVKERTKEIGILKAIGAKRRDILLQFLLEAIIISAGGGIIAIVLGIILMPLAEYGSVRVIPSLEGNVIALIFSIVTGTFFGYYPASKGATLKPIDALNYE
ncbi:ABC transporter permease [Anaeromicrobium sediminis]|uniref:Macrolide ABC transporter permease n=1 Tax=Anaeromicrobium sediminis TaxID=1478221 RepID=A0A267MCQ2_9FIRM|nr:ABC transporter permease [Anaeromicrobium sediminis]PAB57237.1 hypothetical protein CCE28_19325 [Anaeromicrobium sediminis]